MGLREYWQKRDFKKTLEPSGRKKVAAKKSQSKRTAKSEENVRSFVIQKHDASHLHYDFRLELDGVLKSWAVPKGPSLDPKDKRLAMQVEDHPLDYASFEGSIPAGEYGGGDVIVWDRGEWVSSDTPEEDLKKGRLEFELRGEKLSGKWILVRTGRQSSKPQWLLMKRTDSAAISHDEFDVTEDAPQSVKTGGLLPMDVKAGKKPIKLSGKGKTAGAGRAGAAKAAAASKSSAGLSSRKKTTKASSKLASSMKAETAPKASSRAGKAASGRAGATKSLGRASAASSSKKKAVKKSEADFPGFIKPQLARLVDSAPAGSDWIHEIKFDGYRAVSTLQDGEVKMFTRSGLNWTEKYGSVAEALSKLKAENAVFDGEVVWIDQDGRSDFSGLQAALSDELDKNLVYFIFDLLWLNGEDLRERPLIERKELLEKLIGSLKDDTVRYSDHWTEDGPSVLKASCNLNMEGIISKRVDSTYESTRSDTWVKTKCLLGQEFVIGGFTAPKGSRNGFGALLLGAKDENGKLRYVGRVGTGFGAKLLDELRAKFKSRIRSSSPFEVESPKGKEITFIKPDLVCQVKFTEWTSEGILRHPTFEGLRGDKKAEQVVIEKPKDARAAIAAAKKEVKATKSSGGTNGTYRSSKSAKVVQPVGRLKGKAAHKQLTHPDKLLYPEVGLTKDRVATYYDKVAKFMMPHLENRPIAMVRCPDGAGGECFFQKKLGNHPGKALKEEKRKGMKGKTESLVFTEEAAGLTELVQMGVLEIHAWGAKMDDITRPNLIVFDLDPEDTVTFEFVKETAIKIRDLLADMGLKSFVKTTGGKGLHVHVPIIPEHDFDKIKAFSHAVVRHLEKESPDLYTTQILKSKRHGRIFLDYLRNGYGATAIVPYSLRSKPNATASVPLDWKELRTLKSAGSFTLVDVERRMARRKDPWAGYFKVRQRLRLK